MKHRFSIGGNKGLAATGLALVFLSAGLSSQAWNFVPFPAGGMPGTAGGDMVAGDLDGDGKAELVLCGMGTNAAETLVYRYAQGGYVPVADHGIPAFGPGTCLVLADLDGDGRKDLAVAGWDDKGKAVLKTFHNKGGMKFAAAEDFRGRIPAPGGADSLPPGTGSKAFLAAADLDGDKDQDLVYAGFDGWSTGVLRNDGSGKFKTVESGLSGICRVSGCVADFDKDGKADLVLSGSAGPAPVVVPVTLSWKGNGDGSFASVPLPGPSGILDGNIFAGDLNLDSIPDLGFTGYNNVRSDGSGGRLLELWISNGDGTFHPDLRQTVLVPMMHSDGALGDLDGDGDPDMVVAGDSGTNVLKLYQNDEGISQPKFLERTIQGLVADHDDMVSLVNCNVVLADLDGDGDLDVVVTGKCKDIRVQVFMNLMGH